VDNFVDKSIVRRPAARAACFPALLPKKTAVKTH
jgi:hypothetical protein